jgi:ribosome-binding protein aMBF1 (putative translation factor)
MTPSARLRAALAELHWSGRGLAAILRRDERMVRRWAAGTYQPPEDVLTWLEALASFHAAHPPP